MKTISDLLYPFALVAFIFVAPGALSAQQVHQCNGTWTTVECDQLESSSAQFSLSRIETPQIAPLEQQKRRLLEDFERLRLGLAREHGFYFRPGLEESTCLNPESSLEQCNHAISESEARLMKRVELEQKSTKVEVIKQQGDNIAVSVSDNRDYSRQYWYPIRRPIAPIIDGTRRETLVLPPPQVREGTPNLNRRVVKPKE